ncbi:histidine phosphatase family protein [soil metagenome]
MSLIHLIRHGQPLSGWGEPGGSPDPGLSPAGMLEAQAAAQALSALPAGERPTRVLTSPLRRCRETAAPFAALLGVDPVVEPAVAEIATPEGVVGEDRAPWLRKAMGGTWGGVEGLDGEAWRAAVVAALLQAEGAAVFTHFVAINAAVTAALRSPDVLAFKPAPGSVTTLRVQDGGLHLLKLGAALPEAGRVL